MKLESIAVEEWAKEFESCEKRNLTKEEAEILVRICLNENEINEDKKLLDLLNNDNSPDSMAKVVYQRIKSFHTYQISPSVALLLEMLVVKNFGSSTMICAYLQYKSHNLGVKIIDGYVFCKDIFPFGIPTDEELNRLWNLQKLDPDLLEKRESMFESDNGLDYKVTYESIMDIKGEK